jgi:hypothetical protein
VWRVAGDLSVSWTATFAPLWAALSLFSTCGCARLQSYGKPSALFFGLVTWWLMPVTIALAKLADGFAVPIEHALIPLWMIFWYVSDGRSRGGDSIMLVLGLLQCVCAWRIPAPRRHSTQRGPSPAL